MNIKTNTVTLLFLMFVILSCQNQIKVDQEMKQLNQDSLNLRETVAEKKNFFLYYWGGMTTTEFREVNKILSSDRKLAYYKNEDKYYYKMTPNCSSEFYPYFEDGRLYAITLEASECIYKLFKEKYNLPPLKTITYVEQSTWGNNPEYDPVMTYFDNNNKLRNLPNAFRDNFNLTSLNNSKDSGPSSREMLVLQQDSISVKTENSNILIYQKFRQDPILAGGMKYSLQISPEIYKYYQTSSEVDDLRGGGFNDHRLTDILNRNSRFRKLLPYTESIIYVKYIPLEYNNKIKMDNEAKERSDKQKRIQQIKAEKEAINDI